MTIYSCAFCLFRSSNGIEFGKPYFQAHAFESSFCYTCGISSCSHVFVTGASFEMFRGHCARKHHNWQHCFIPTVSVLSESDIDGDTPSTDDSNAPNLTPEVSTYNSVDQDMDTNQDMSTGQDMDTFNHDNVNIDDSEYLIDNVKISAAKFILILKERFKLTQASIDYTIKAVEEMMLISANMLRQSIVDNTDHVTVPFELRSPLVNPFVGLKTGYQLLKFFKENFGLIVSDFA